MADKQIKKIYQDKSKKGLQKQLKKVLNLLKNNPRHTSLHSHLMEPKEQKVWTSYVQNNTPSAYRILWEYGKKEKTINILQVMPHY